MSSNFPFPDDIAALKALLLERDALLLQRDGEVQSLRDTVSTLELALSVRTLEIEQLTLQIAKLKRMVFGRKSEKIDKKLEQLETRLEDLIAEEGAAEQTLNIPAPPRQKSVHKPLPEYLPRDSDGGLIEQGKADVVVRIIDARLVVNAHAGVERRAIRE